MDVAMMIAAKIAFVSVLMVIVIVIVMTKAIPNFFKL